MTSTAAPNPTTTVPLPQPAAEPSAALTLPTPTGVDATSAANSPPAPEPATAPLPPSAATAEASAPTATTATPTTKAAEAATVEDEDQSALTSLFTQAEWKALNELRSQLADVIHDAYVDSKREPKPTVASLWGVTLDPQNVKDKRTSVVLVKFLRARNLSVSDAKAMLLATLRWRDEFDIETAMKEQYPEDVFGGLGHVYGKDKEGRPITYNVYGANKDTKAVFGDVQRFLRWRVALMEKSLELIDFENVDQTVQIHDYAGVSMFASRDASTKNAASEASSIFNNHYPELLYKKFFINAPSLMHWMFWLFKPLLPAKTLSKMTVVGSGHRAITEALEQVIPKSELPKRYGGQAEGF